MFIIGKNKKKLNEANEKALTPVCTVQVQKIFALLHAKAITTVEKECPTCKIENTAADGNDPKKAVFHSAGEHMLVVRSSGKEDEDGNPAEVTKDDALKAIQTYVSIFCGKDIGENIKEDEVFPLPAGDGEEAMTESIVPSFNMFLSESAGMKFIAEADEAGDEEDADEMDDDIDADEMDDDIDADEMDDDIDADEMDDDDEDDEAEEEEEGAEGEDEEEGAEGEDDENDDESEEEEGGEEDEAGDEKSAVGYYLLYGLRIKGLKETTAADALKEFGSNFLKGFGVKLIDGWGSSGGELHTIGGLKKGLRSLFGAIDDPDQLCRRVQAEMNKKYSNVGEITCLFRDKKTLIKELDKNHKKSPYIEGWPDGKNRQKINSADNSMYIKVEKDSLKEPYVNKKTIANIVTMQIKGLFKKFKHMIKAEDIIYIKGKGLAGDSSHSNDSQQRSAVPSYSTVYDTFYNDDDEYNYSRKKVNTLNDKFAQLAKNPKYKDNEDATKIRTLWDKFNQKYSQGKAKPVEDQTMHELLIPYEKLYKEFAKKYPIGDEILESMFTAYDILTEMFGNTTGNDCVEYIFEDNTAENKDQDKQSSEEKKPKDQNKENDKIAETDFPIYFAVPDDDADYLSPKVEKLAADPKSYKLLNGGMPVAKKDIPGLLKSLQDEAQNNANSAVGIQQNETEMYKNVFQSLYEDDDEPTEEDTAYEFKEWVPDWKTVKDSNGKVDDKDAIIIFAKFEEVEKNSNNNTQANNDDTGDSLFIIPMPGVTFDASSDKDDFKGAGYEND